VAIAKILESESFVAGARSKKEEEGVIVVFAQVFLLVFGI
jgi:hypothetical protein